jgi:hypothetical protein
MVDYPHYSYPLHLLPGLAAGLLFGARRSFRQDACACIQRLQPPLRVWGAENIPACGPCLLTGNHYSRPGFNSWWNTFALASAVPVEMHWVTTTELTFPGRWYAFLASPSSRWLLRRLAGMYGFTGMPPMPPREKDVLARARAVRRVLDHARRNPGSMLAISPEGGDSPDGVLAWPPTGVGRFLLLLSGSGFPILPVGCWEEEGALCLRFGPAYRLQIPPRLGVDERDHRAAAVVMQAIARLLPLHLRGEFHQPATGRVKLRIPIQNDL